MIDPEKCVIELNRPERGNSLTAAMLREFARRVTEAGQSVVVLCGRGSKFCTGVDLDEVYEAGSAKKHVSLIQRYIDEGNKPDQPGYFVQWLHRQVPVYGHVLEGTWYDIGDINSYNKANEVFAEGA